VSDACLRAAAPFWALLGATKDIDISETAVLAKLVLS
jgi:hypothetical protein